MADTILKIENVSKEYRLGAIGGTTLREEMHRFADKLFHRNTANANDGKRFMALQDVSFEIKKGERVGIIGRNGAGKSTLLKLLSRVTAPTTGTISYNGRISSMLEVGTGFHGELTGRENIYMNGAILGMTKHEIDSKINQIIEFAEMEQFIDTPVKRYSSGMYVKLAFAVAAHLDNEILIMDEVLAVGDVKFQQKCLGKMDDTSKQDGKTVLFVSHNMNLIRQLCNRCVVLDMGRVVYDGDVETAIGYYMDLGVDLSAVRELTNEKRCEYVKGISPCLRFSRAEILNPAMKTSDEKLRIKLQWDAIKADPNIYFRIEFSTAGNPITTAFTETNIDISACGCILEIDTTCLIDSIYDLCIRASRKVDGVITDIDLATLPTFSKELPYSDIADWNKRWWGYIRMPDIKVEPINYK